MKHRTVILPILFSFILFISGFFVSYAENTTNYNDTVNFHAFVTDPYGQRETRYHNGVDFGADFGTMIPSLVDGTVYGDQTGYNADPEGYGNMIAVVSDDGEWSFVYGHVQAIYVEPGQHVKMGQPLGEVGSTGHSTGPHLHVTAFRNALPYSGTPPTDPSELIDNCPFFKIDGDLSSNAIGESIRKLIPHLNMDYAPFFHPSSEIEGIGKKVISLITNAFDMGQQYLFPLLVSLALIDFSWFMFGLILGLRNDKGLAGVIVRLLRYSFFFFIFKSWHWIISNFVIPFVENISSVFTGHTFTESSFLHFDELFTSVTHVISPFLHVDERFSLFVGVFVAIIVSFILLLTMVTTFYMMYKLVLFYMVCAFGVLGIPCLFINKIKPYGKNMVSTVFGSAFDLIMTAFIYVFICNQLSGMDALSSDSISGLLMFTGSWFMLVLFLPKFSDSALQAFASLWD